MCFMCNAGMHSSCTDFDCICAMNNHTPTIEGQNEISDTDSDDGESRYSTGGRSNKRDAALKDQQSTGRKRAAKLYPLHRDDPCEWAGMTNNGGGPHPILGCLEGKQEARHHGPDKNVSNNEPGNVHRICHFCHYQWHAANDSEYDWNASILTSHRPVKMSEADEKASAMKYLKSMNKKMSRIKD